MAPLVMRFPKYQRYMIWVGWCICILGILAGSFMDTLPGLIMTQGVTYGGTLIFHYARAAANILQSDLLCSTILS
jgi:hypothetical protein